jgi:hypothetical protein
MKTRHAQARGCASDAWKLLKSRKGQESRDIPGPGMKNPTFGSASLQLTLEKDEHVIRRVAFAKDNFSRLGSHILSLPGEPGKLLLRQIREDGNVSQVSSVDHRSPRY